MTPPSPFRHLRARGEAGTQRITNIERLAAAAVMIGLVPLGTQISAIVLGAVVTALLGALAVWELRGSSYADRLAARKASRVAPVKAASSRSRSASSAVKSAPPALSDSCRRP